MLEKLGEGGMGVVYAAYDSTLSRRVALKLLRVEGGKDDGDARLRLMREAQALAQLSHPGVVAVYEVGQHDSDVFIAMELVDGTTLRDWLKERTRAWSDVLDVCLAAGRGLAAAHAAGLVHRDFKPANVLVGKDGRVRVMDFGLARAATSRGTAERTDVPPVIPATPRATDSNTSSHSGNLSHSDASGPSLTSVSGGLLHSHVTQYGAVLGTPAYMAPEQLMGREADARSDQYSYCVSVWQALYGERPKKENAAATRPPRRSRVPSWVHAALVRGLAASPDERFATMDALLDALSSDPAARRKKLLWATAAAVVLLGVTSGSWAWHRHQRQLCRGAEGQLTGVWDEDRRTKVEAGLLATGAAYAPGVWAYVRPQLDAYARAWADQHTEACEATSVRGEVSSEVLDLRMACLHRARVKLEAAADVLQSADAKALHKAHDVVGGLDALSRCADVNALRADVQPPSPHEADAVNHVRALLAQAYAQRKAGQLPLAKASLDKAEAVLAQVTFRPVVTELLLEKGELLSHTGEYDGAERALRDALQAAAQWKQWNEARRASTSLLVVVGYLQARPKEALHYRELAAGLVKGQEDPLAEAQLHLSLGQVFFRQGQYEDAEAAHRQALALREKALGTEHLEVAHSLNNLGSALWPQGKLDEAEAHYKRSLRLRENMLGPEHPDVAGSHTNLAIVLHDQKKYDEAASRHRIALKLFEKALGPDHPNVGSSLNNLALVLLKQKKHAEAETVGRSAVAVWERVLGADHPKVAMARSNLGLVLHARGRHAEAEAECRSSLSILLKAYGTEHPNLPMAHSDLAVVLAAQGKHTEAEAHHRRALMLFEKSVKPEDPELASSRLHLASLLLETRRPAEALSLAQQVWAVRGKETSPPDERAKAAFLLARALWAGGGDKARARTLATQAAELYGQSNETQSDVVEVRAWLRRTGSNESPTARAVTRPAR